ncbi:MAG TPA: hypothetical protein ENJ69_03195 [Bacteroidetes bacterium]|nr:hypothetical protein [Bacteroidota bacterium]
MKKYIFLALLLTGSLAVQAQEKGGMSLEAGAAYYHPFFGGNTKNNFNYGFSLLVSKRFRNVKVSAGIDYATKKYYYEVNPTGFNPLTKREYDMQYLNFPFLVNITVARLSEKAELGLLTGLVLNKVAGYKIISTYANHPVSEDDLEIPASMGLTFRLGAAFSLPLGNRFRLNLTPFGDIKLVMNGNQDSSGDPYAGSYRNLPDNRFTLGIQAGMEYLFK